MKEIKALYAKYKSIILYLFFGGCTTLINIVFYYVLYNLLSLENVPSTIIAWFVSVLFAFVTNRRYVFEQDDNTASRRLRDFCSFVGCRLATGIMDVGIMYFAVDRMHWNSLLWKIISNILVIIINYIASKYLIFTPSEKKKT